MYASDGGETTSVKASKPSNVRALVLTDIYVYVLVGSIPHATMRLSKMEILRTGIQHIKRLNEEIAALEAEVRGLRELKRAMVH